MDKKEVGVMNKKPGSVLLQLRNCCAGLLCGAALAWGLGTSIAHAAYINPFTTTPVMQISGAEEVRSVLKMQTKNISVFPMGEKNDAYAKYFAGQSYLNMLSTEQVVIGNVTFEPGCRNNWHIHQAKSGGGQILLVTAGRGYYQEWGSPARELLPGDVVNIPAGVKHWHGAVPDSWFAHLAVEVPAEEGHTEWLEPVSAADYGSLA